MTLNLSAPWYLLYKKMVAMFEDDKEIHIVYDDAKKTIYLYVDSVNKAEALDVLLEHEFEFGGTKVYVTVVPANDENKVQLAKQKVEKALGDNRFADLFNDILEGNRAYADIYVTPSVFMGGITYVLFSPGPVQIFTDELNCWQGFRTMLFEDIARVIFKELDGVYFSSDLIYEEK